MPTVITRAATPAVLPSQTSALGFSPSISAATPVSAAPPATAARRSHQGEIRIGSGAGEGGGGCERAREVLDRDPAAEAAVGVDRHQRAEAAQVRVRQQRVERGIVADEEAAVVVDDVRNQRDGAGDLGDVVGGFALEQAEEPVGGVDDREPGPAVAEEVL